MCCAVLLVSWFLWRGGKVRALPLPLILAGRGRGRVGAGCVGDGSVMCVVACMVVSSVNVGRGPK